MEHVLKHEEEQDLRDDVLPGGERHLPGRHAEHFCHGVEEPDLQTRVSDASEDEKIILTTGSSTVK